VNGICVADMVFSCCKLAPALVVNYRKLYPQANRIVWPTRKAHLGFFDSYVVGQAVSPDFTGFVRRSAPKQQLHHWAMP